jgi:hypothetical protein
MAREGGAVKRILLLLPAFAALLAGLLFLVLHEQAPVLGGPAPPEPPAPRETASDSVKLSYVEAADAPHRSEQPGATQVFGWLTRADDGQPARGGTLILYYFDHARSAESAAEEHARALANARMPHTSQLATKVQEDGGWYTELPGRAWIDNSIYMPDPGNGAGAHLARTGVGIDLPLERGALRISFRVDVALEARGIVVDELGAPIANATICPRAFGEGNIFASSGQDGGFVIADIAPQDLIAERGLISFLVRADGYELVKRSVGWEAGQTLIPPFRVVLSRAEQR